MLLSGRVFEPGHGQAEARRHKEEESRSRGDLVPERWASRSSPSRWGLCGCRLKVLVTQFSLRAAVGVWRECGESVERVWRPCLFNGAAEEKQRKPKKPQETGWVVRERVSV